MDKSKLQIGVAMSGGGIRATIFHLGVLRWMAENNLLEKVVRVSSVSGGSLCIGLLYAHNSYRWPNSYEYLNNILPKIRGIILTKDIQNISLCKLLVSPMWWGKRVNFLSRIMQDEWGISGSISYLEKKPKWYINCTTFETGKRFRFTQEEMGDYTIGYVREPEFPISDAIAASAGYPVFIGPYRMDTRNFNWEKSYYSKQDWVPTKHKFIHLWDGGVYDNLGLESIYKLDNGGTLSEGVNFMIVSNASGPIGNQIRKKIHLIKNTQRLLEISMDQIKSLRNRSVLDYIKRTNKGMYIMIGNSAKMICESSGVPDTIKKQLISKYMVENDTLIVRDYKLTLRKPSELDYDLILKHGYETAQCIYQCYFNDQY